MCSAPAVKTVVRAAAGVMTFGTSEIARKIPGVSNIAKAPENLAAAATTALGITKPEVPAAPEPPPAPTPTDVGGEPPPTPGAPAPGATTVDSSAARRRKKLSTLQAGLLSTIATSAQGLSGAPALSTPTASGGAGKTLLGQ